MFGLTICVELTQCVALQSPLGQVFPSHLYIEISLIKQNALQARAVAKLSEGSAIERRRTGSLNRFSGNGRAKFPKNYVK